MRRIQAIKICYDPVAVNHFCHHHDTLVIAFTINHNVIRAVGGEEFSFAELVEMQFQNDSECGLKVWWRV